MHIVYFPSLTYLGSYLLSLFTRAARKGLSKKLKSYNITVAPWLSIVISRAQVSVYVVLRTRRKSAI